MRGSYLFGFFQRSGSFVTGTTTVTRGYLGFRSMRNGTLGLYGRRKPKSIFGGSFSSGMRTTAVRPAP